MNGKRFSEQRARRNGFYLALAVCLVAVGIAAWSTYDAVHSYTATNEPDQSSLNQMQAEEVRSSREEEVSSTSRTEDESGDKAYSASKAPEQTARAVGPASSAVSGATPSPVPAPQPEQQEEESVTVPATAPLYERSTSMIWPLESEELIKQYSAGAPVYSATMKDWRIHTGADQAAQAGEELHACANGQVKSTYTDTMLGNVIVIEHGDYEFSYCGVDEAFQVKEGDIVTKGQTIGTVTAVPCEAADQPHLHIEVRRDGVCLDPQDVINGQA